MFYYENEYINYHLTTVVNFDNFTFCVNILSNVVIETSNWFYFLSNALSYIQIKFCDHKLISLGTTVQNMHSNTKKSSKLYILWSLLWLHYQKINQIFYYESTIKVLIFRLTLELTFYGKYKCYFWWHKTWIWSRKMLLLFREILVFTPMGQKFSLGKTTNLFKSQ